jgi:DNA-nicking Smr family endonuclease
MKRTLRPDELKLWSAVAATVRPAPGRSAPPAPAEAPVAAAPAPPPKPHAPSAPQAHRRAKAAPRAPDPVEPGRKRLLTRERVVVDARLDLHGLDYDRARAALRLFIRRAVAERWRHVLIITGKGPGGVGLLRQFTPSWLASPACGSTSPAFPPHIAGMAARGRSTWR